MNLVPARRRAALYTPVVTDTPPVSPARPGSGGRRRGGCGDGLSALPSDSRSGRVGKRVRAVTLCAGTRGQHSESGHSREHHGATYNLHRHPPFPSRDVG